MSVSISCLFNFRVFYSFTIFSKIHLFGFLGGLIVSSRSEFRYVLWACFGSYSNGLPLSSSSLCLLNREAKQPVRLSQNFPFVLVFFPSNFMEAQRMLSGFCPNPAIPSIQNTKKPIFATVPSRPTCSFVQSRSWVCHRAFISISQRARRRNRIECRNNAAEVVDVTSGEDWRSGVRRKKLAVFVSGGGSNFRSIHEASLRGSIHGDIVVLVTNKLGIVLFLCYWILQDSHLFRSMLNRLLAFSEIILFIFAPYFFWAIKHWDSYI